MVRVRALMETKAQPASEPEQVLRAYVPVFFLVTRAPQQAAEELATLGESLGMEVCEFHPARGLKGNGNGWEDTDPLDLMMRIVRRHLNSPEGDAPVLWVLQMFHLFLRDPDPLVLSALAALNEQVRFSASVAILVEPGFRAPAGLESVPVLEHPLPGANAFARLVHSDLAPLAPAETDEIVRTLSGLTLREAETVLALSLAGTGRLDTDRIRGHRNALIRKQGDGLLEFPGEGFRLEDVGGMGALVSWLKIRECAFREPARLVPYRLTPPRGILLLGVPGCGKTLMARAIAGSWKLPLVKLNAGRLFTSQVGGSEKRLFQALDTVRAMAPCVLLLDEMEKGFSPVSGFSDGGTALRVQATLLDFLQERSAPVFVTATCNGLRALAPEWMRRGRWDEIFFIDLPSGPERRQIFRVLFRRHNLDHPVEPDLVRFSKGFSGAEMEQALRDALYRECVYAARPFYPLALLRQLRGMVPLSRMREQEIADLRAWASSRTRPASSDHGPEACAGR